MADSAVSVQASRFARLGRLMRFEERGIVVGLIVIALLIGIPHPAFFKVGAIREVLRHASFTGAIAFGMVFLMAMGEIDLSVAGMFALAGTLFAALTSWVHIDPWVAVVLCLLAGVVMGTINGLVTNFMRIPLLIVSLALLPFYYGINLVITKGYAIQGMPLSHKFFPIFGGNLFHIPVSVWVVVAFCIILHVVLRRTGFGATVRAIGSNPIAADFIAIPVRRVRVDATALVGLLSAIAGIEALAFFKSAEPNVGLGMELRVIAAVVIGGTSLDGGSGTVVGAFLGALIISAIDSGISFYGIDPIYSQLVTGMVIVAAIAVDRVVKRRG